MSDETTVNINHWWLDHVIKMLANKTPTARIGVLANQTTRSVTGVGKNNPNNAEVGAAHEFGTSTLPVRSFLRMPISTMLQKRLESSGAFDNDTLSEVVKQGSVVPWVKKMAALAESIVLEAFDTGGFGKWKKSNMDHKKTKQTLVETQQLRDSITSEVKE